MIYITKNCLNCQKEFQALEKEIKRGNGKFCTRVCSAKFNMRVQNSKRIPNCICSNCGNEFYRNKSKQTNKTGLLFCSRNCKDHAQKLSSGFTDLHPEHYGTGKHDHPKYYRKIAFEHHPNECKRCSWNKFIPVLRVHHIDRNRENNKPENLEILCPTCHEIEHYLTGDGPYGNGKKYNEINKLVEPTGLEPVTSSLQS